LANSPSNIKLLSINHLDDGFARRFCQARSASAALAQLGALAETALRQALKNNLSAEAQRRIEQLLDQIDHQELSRETLRGMRTVEILENLGTPDAREIMRILSQGAPDPELIEQAKDSLRRVARRAIQPRP